jgi:hypothetical protein
MKHNFNHLIAGYWAGVYSQSERVDLEEAVFSAITPYMFVTYGDAKAEPRFVAVGSQVRSSIGAVVGSSILSLFGVSDRSLIRKLFRLYASLQKQIWLNNDAVRLRFQFFLFVRETISLTVTWAFLCRFRITLMSSFLCL